MQSLMWRGRCRKTHSRDVDPATTMTTASYFYRRNTTKRRCVRMFVREDRAEQKVLGDQPGNKKKKASDKELSSTRSNAPKYIARERADQVSRFRDDSGWTCREIRVITIPQLQMHYFEIKLPREDLKVNTNFEVKQILPRSFHGPYIKKNSFHITLVR